MAEHCPICNGTGWRPVTIDGARRVMRCECIPRQRAVEERARPGGFSALAEGIPRLIDELNPNAQQVRSIILEHRGEANAVTVAEICATLWPEVWGGGPVCAEAARARENCVRVVKQLVSDLVTLGHMLIGSSRDPKRPGYFLIETPQELDRQRAHCLHHLRAWCRRFRALDPEGHAARELYGQMRADLGIREEAK